MLKVAVLINVMQGDEMADGCLEECQKQIDSISEEGKYSFSIFLNAEGKDGFLSVFTKAAEISPDFYLWLNRDLTLKENALASMLENSEFLRHKAIIAGTVCGFDRTILFGGRSRRGKLLDPDPIIPIPCHLYDMALLLVPSYAVSKVEIPSDIFRQGFFDYGYGEKAAKVGVGRVLAPGVLAQTSRKSAVPVWMNPNMTPLERMESMLKSVGKEILRVIRSFFR